MCKGSVVDRVAMPLQTDLLPEYRTGWLCRGSGEQDGQERQNRAETYLSVLQAM